MSSMATTAGRWPARGSMSASFDGRRSPGEVPRTRTDGQGRARVIPWPGDRFWIFVYPPEGEPYLPARLDVNWPKGAVQHAVEVKLGRGVLVRGRLIEDPAGTPVVGGWVGYLQTRRGNPRPLRLPAIQAVSGPDGTFTLVVPSGPGHLLVQGPSADYLHLTTSNVEMGVGLRPSFHLYPDAHAVLDIKDGEAPRPLELRLHRGVTVAGRVVAPDGKPVAEAFAFGRSYVPFGEPSLPHDRWQRHPAANRGEGRPVRDPWLRPGEAGHVLLPRC